MNKFQINAILYFKQGQLNNMRANLAYFSISLSLSLGILYLQQNFHNYSHNYHWTSGDMARQYAIFFNLSPSTTPQQCMTFTGQQLTQYLNII
jgi:hypothetical protein